MAQRRFTCSLFLLALLLLLLTGSTLSRKVTSSGKVPRNAVLLSSISSLTLRAGKLTSSRRVEPVSQLTCVGPEAICALHRIDLMRCKNEGADYDVENIQWACRASLPAEFKLGSTEVVCEGYESSEDPYVLKGSCAVEYRLLLTDKGEVKYEDYLSSRPSDGGDSGKSSKLGGTIFVVIFLAVLFVIVASIVSSARNNPPRLGGGRRGNGGDDDPPPPYDDPPPYDPYTPKKGGSKTSSTRASASQSRSAGTRTDTRGARQQQQQQAQGPWRPGFWTGAAAGAAAGYGANRLYQNRTQTQHQPQMQEQPRYTRPASPPSAPSPSFERHESTGFGGTRRR